ncbi:hypothetical protein JCM11251_007786 [Rhodosporidiobolus azoricus]
MSPVDTDSLLTLVPVALARFLSRLVHSTSTPHSSPLLPAYYAEVETIYLSHPPSHWIHLLGHLRQLNLNLLDAEEELEIYVHRREMSRWSGVGWYQREGRRREELVRRDMEVWAKKIMEVETCGAWALLVLRERCLQSHLARSAVDPYQPTYAEVQTALAALVPLPGHLPAREVSHLKRRGVNLSAPISPPCFVTSPAPAPYELAGFEHLRREFRGEVVRGGGREGGLEEIC